MFWSFCHTQKLIKVTEFLEICVCLYALTLFSMAKCASIHKMSSYNLASGTELICMARVRGVLIHMRNPHDRSKISESNSHTNKTCLNTIPNKHSLTSERLTQTLLCYFTAGSQETPQHRLGGVNIYPHDRFVIRSLKLGLKETNCWKKKTAAQRPVLHQHQHHHHHHHMFTGPRKSPRELDAV